jgi:hypothetical protein
MTNINQNISMLKRLFPSFTLREAGVAYACIEQLAEHIASETAMMQHHYTDTEIAAEVLLQNGSS